MTYKPVGECLKDFIVFFICLVMASSWSVYAESYYSDVRVDLDDNGVAVFSGTTNHPLMYPGSTDNLTSKRGSYWLFNLTLPAEDIFTYYVYEVNLPEGASINYVRSNGQFRITTADSRISVRGLGENKSFSVVIQYMLGEGATEEPGSPGDALILIMSVFLIAGLGYVYLRYRAKESGSDLPVDETLPDLTDRQLQILDLVKSHKRPVNQTRICNDLDLPKSSVSRNVDALVKKGLLKKTRTGMSTMISLNVNKK